MIVNTLTIENLTAIHSAMSKIKEIDRSNYFNQYFTEVESRITDEKFLQNINKVLGGYANLSEEDRNFEDDVEPKR
jgi:N-acetylneuraminic acid mutarotase